MQYLGSKNKIAKQILPIILAERKPGQYWVEPFVGGANMIDKVTGPRIGNDKHRYLIALLKAIQSGWVPPVEISEEEYSNIRKNPEKYKDEVVGFVGFLCSFGACWFKSYAKNKHGRNYAENGSRGLIKQAEHLGGVLFQCGDYQTLEIPPKSLIYCDPPYQNTAGYKDSINHLQFWNWCTNKSQEGHTVFVSEYSIPDEIFYDFECVKTIEHKSSLNRNKTCLRTERLYRCWWS